MAWDEPAGEDMIMESSFTPSAPVLSIRGLRVEYGRTQAVRGIDLDIRPGEIFALVGESGSGKSTTAQAVIGLLPKDAKVTGGQIFYAGADLTKLDERRYRRLRGGKIALIPQDPVVSLNPIRRIGDQIAEVLSLHIKLRARDASERAVEILAEAGFHDPGLRARQYPHELSGGMKQRVLIGMALACAPEVLVADEPTSALDVTVQKMILDHLDERIASTTAGVLLITHDLGVAMDRADRIAVMRQGEIVETGLADEIAVSPRHPYTQHLFSVAPSLSSTRMTRSGPSSIATESIEPIVETGVDHVLEVRGLVKDFDIRSASADGQGSFRAVDSVSFVISRGSTFALVGESGSGKSTTARMVLRLEEPTAGSIVFDGQDITELSDEPLRQLRRRIQVVYQSPYASLNPRFSIDDIISEPSYSFRVGDRRSRRKRSIELLERVALPSSVLDRRPSELSGGQRQRVAIARALSVQPDLIVLDEPVSALDVSVQHQILQLLVDLQADHGISYLFISHDLAVVRQISDHVAVMQAGRILEQGPTTRILTDPHDPYTRRLLDAIPGKKITA